MKVWVTIYVHEGGEIQCWEDALIVGREYARIPDPNYPHQHIYHVAKHGEWFASEVEARERANEIVAQKVAELKAELAKFEAMKF